MDKWRLRYTFSRVVALQKYPGAFELFYYHFSRAVWRMVKKKLKSWFLGKLNPVFKKKIISDL